MVKHQFLKTSVYFLLVYITQFFLVFFSKSKVELLLLKCQQEWALSTSQVGGWKAVLGPPDGR